MKKIIILSSIVMIVFACNNEGTKDATKDSTGKTEKKDDAGSLSDNPDYQKGLALIGQNDCLTCHRVDEKLTGPAYRDVANRYSNASDTLIDRLAKKVIRGGNDGTWENMSGPMTPHPALSEDDARAMVKYILLLKK